MQGWRNNGWKRKDGPLKNPELIKELYELCQYHNVKWIKVKGHADNEYNNRCDELAVQAAAKYKNGNVSENTASVRDTEYSGELFEKIIKTETMFTGRVFKVEVSEVELPDGQRSTREIIRHNGGAAIVAIDENNNITTLGRGGSDTTAVAIAARELRTLCSPGTLSSILSWN